MRLIRVTEVHHRPGGYYFRVWRTFPSVFAVSISAAVCLCLIAFLEQSQLEISVFHLSYAAIAAAIVFVGLFVYHIWKCFQRSEWGIYIEPGGLFINTRPTSRPYIAEGEAKVLHLTHRDIESARRVVDTTRLYPGSFRWVEKSRSSCLELTIKDGVTLELADWLRRLSCEPRLRELVIVPAMLNDKALVVYWRNEDFQMIPSCATALRALRENGVVIEEAVVLGA